LHMTEANCVMWKCN